MGLGRAYALAALAGVLYFTGFAGIDVWPLSFVCLIPLFVILDRAELGAKQAAWLGLWFGSVTNWGGYYWLIGMLQEFGGFPYVVCVLFALLVCFYQGGQLGLFFWLLWRARSRGRDPLLWAVPVYGACEFAYPLLFPSYFANCLHGQPLLNQIADLGGPTLISMWMVAINAALYAGYQALRGVAGPSAPRRRGLLIGTAAAVAFSLGYGAYRIDEVDRRVARAPKIDVGVVQANMGIFEKRRNRREGHRRHLEGSHFLERHHDLDLLIWPESAYSYSLSATTTRAPAVLGDLQTPLLFGGLRHERARPRTRLYNSAFMLDRDARITGTVDKTHLLAFGEYLPFGEDFPVLYEWSPNSSFFTPGNHQRPLRLGDYRITTLICYEDVLPSFVRSAMNVGDSHLLVNITNDAWFGDTTEPWIHLALAKLRAVEHHRYLIRATNSGVTAVIDPVGRTVQHTGTFERANLYAEVAMLDGSSVYRVVGDWPGWLALLLTLWIQLRRRGAGGDARPTSRPSEPASSTA